MNTKEKVAAIRHRFGGLHATVKPGQVVKIRHEGALLEIVYAGKFSGGAALSFIGEGFEINIPRGNSERISAEGEE